ncbi:PREDICTED: uncharacterized protein LOC109132996 [Camelina sativa]|uniref:Uncharacterized protein LOC109132996 n=1 Tax=Camelina sativa TaxID=90675 RepID=A0ABM1RPX5_CAMSA|nr:PREDICTED: uncharacterized protein LOC109132996 [Camelina sativa]
MNHVVTSKGKKTTGPWYSINTVVFWLVEETLASTDHLISSCIGAALPRMGYIGPLSIFAFGTKEEHSSIASVPGIFFYESLDNKESTIIQNMLFRMTTHASSLSEEEEKCLMLIIKNPRKDDEILRVLDALESRGFHVLLVQPPHDDDEAQEVLFSSVDSVLQCTRLLDGSSPIDFDDPDSFCYSSQSSWETDYSDTDSDNLDDSTSYTWW